MKIIGVQELSLLIQNHGISQFLDDLIKALRIDFSRWGDFDKSARYASYVPGGVVELMPIRDQEYFSYKYVNGHPQNPLLGLQTVVALGQLAEVKTGYPLMISEMTLLTALRTAATAALASDLMSRGDSKVLAIIGTGSQSEFQVLAQNCVRSIQEVRYFDLDPEAMEKFKNNLQGLPLKQVPCSSVEEVVLGADIIVTCTAKKGHFIVLPDDFVKPGMHVNALGGDCPGKTELSIETLLRSQIVVEYLPQTKVEGEIQQLSPDIIEKAVMGEIWEFAAKKKQGRSSHQDITLFDCVGFALEDFSVLRLVYELSNRYGIGQEIDLIPDIQDPKNLFALLREGLV